MIEIKLEEIPKEYIKKFDIRINEKKRVHLVNIYKPFTIDFPKDNIKVELYGTLDSSGYNRDQINLLSFVSPNFVVNLYKQGIPSVHILPK